jgi:hypothetical protein
MLKVAFNCVLRRSVPVTCFRGHASLPGFSVLLEDNHFGQPQRNENTRWT